MAATASSTTPARSPFQPACTAANTPSGLASATGAQSALSTARATPGEALTEASAARPAPPPGLSTTSTSAPCSWRTQLQGRSTTARRRASTAGSTSTTWRPPWPMSPSARPVQRARTPPGPLQDEEMAAAGPVVEAPPLAPSRGPRRRPHRNARRGDAAGPRGTATSGTRGRRTRLRCRFRCPRRRTPRSCYLPNRGTGGRGSGPPPSAQSRRR